MVSGLCINPSQNINYTTKELKHSGAHIKSLIDTIYVYSLIVIEDSGNTKPLLILLIQRFSVLRPSSSTSHTYTHPYTANLHVEKWMFEEATGRRIRNRLISPFRVSKPVGLPERGGTFWDVFHHPFMPLGIVDTSSWMWYPRRCFQHLLIILVMLHLSPTHAIIVVVVQSSSPVFHLPAKYSKLLGC